MSRRNESLVFKRNEYVIPFPLNIVARFARYGLHAILRTASSQGLLLDDIG
jgi:hypothetical protein